MGSLSVAGDPTRVVDHISGTVQFPFEPGCVREVAPNEAHEPPYWLFQFS